MRRLIQTETGVRALWKVTSAGRRLQFHSGIRELIGQFPVGSYLLRTVSPEGVTMSEYLPLESSNQTDFGTHERGRKRRSDRHQCDYTCGIVAKSFCALGEGDQSSVKPLSTKAAGSGARRRTYRIGPRALGFAICESSAFDEISPLCCTFC